MSVQERGQAVDSAIVLPEMPLNGQVRQGNSGILFGREGQPKDANSEREAPRKLIFNPDVGEVEIIGRGEVISLGPISSAVFNRLVQDAGMAVPAREICQVAISAGAEEYRSLASSTIRNLKRDIKVNKIL